MARRKKNKIFEQQTEAQVQAAPVEVPAEELQIEEQPASPPPEMYGDMDKEDFPSRVEALVEDMAKEDFEHELQIANSELLQARQRIQQLEAENKKLQQDNDILVMKLAEMSALQASTQQPQQAPVQTRPAQACAAKEARQPKKVNYIHNSYINNGYGTWH